MKLNKKQIKQIERFAFDYYKKQDSQHNLNHAYKTMKLAIHIARKEKANIMIAKYGALLHQFHPERKKLVEHFLRRIDIDKNIIKQLVHCVECTDRKTIYKAKTLEAKVVFDADKLQAIGPLGVIRNTLYVIEYYKMSFDDAIKYGKWGDKSCFILLQTKTAKKLAKEPHELAMKFYKILDKWNKVEL